MCFDRVKLETWQTQPYVYPLWLKILVPMQGIQDNRLWPSPALSTKHIFVEAALGSPSKQCNRTSPASTLHCVVQPKPTSMKHPSFFFFFFGRERYSLHEASFDAYSTSPGPGSVSMLNCPYHRYKAFSTVYTALVAGTLGGHHFSSILFSHGDCSRVDYLILSPLDHEQYG